MLFETSPCATGAEPRGKCDEELWNGGVGMSEGEPSMAVVKRAEIVGCCHKQWFDHILVLSFRAWAAVKKIHSQIYSTETSGGLSMECAPCWGCREHPQEGNNHHFFPHMKLLNSTILHQPLFIQTGALMSPIQNSRVQMAAAGRIKYKYRQLQDWRPIAQWKTIPEAHDTMRCNALKTINLQWRIIERSYSWHQDFILTTTNSEGIFQ